MSAWIILVAAYGAATLWANSYRPWLAWRLNPNQVANDAPERPPFGDLLLRAFHVRYGAHAHVQVSRKPWSCSQCMAFLVAVPLWVCAQWWPTQVFVVGFAAVGATILLEIAYQYMRVVVG